ncbi:MAG: hypothetical protein CTY15_00700 [Methylocystis sp.]|nr:MAG: hypothetical protein CTY15_00700 [Methylocystis sp.]
MPRVLLAWEGGAGRGHVVTLRSVAAALGAPEHIDAALYRMEHAGEIEDVCGTVFRGAGLRYDGEGRRARGVKTASWGEFLGDLGFRDPDFLKTQIGWWRETILARRCGLVVGDYAPCALLAARSLGVKAVGVGAGYGLPPPGLDIFPVLIEDYSERLYDESEMTGAVNAALAHYGAPPVSRFSDIYAYDDQLVRSLPQLDPYPQARTAPYLPPVADAPQRLYSEGDEIFAYFSTSELDDPLLLDAFLSLDAPRRVFAPGAGAQAREKLARAPGVTLEARPVPVEEIARRSRMIVHSSQNGILALGLACGLSQAAAPQHLEQEFNARKAESLGVLRRLPRRAAEASVLGDVLMDAYESQEMRRAAQAVAQTVRPVFEVDVSQAIRTRLDAVMRAFGP